MSIISPIVGLPAKKKRKPPYKVYHKSYSGAIQEALDYANRRGYKYDEEDVWSVISLGKKKPSEGQTNRFTIGLFKDGKKQNKALQIQVYGKKKSYELNAYIN